MPALLAAGCGGGGDQSAHASADSKAAFIKRADRICNITNRRGENQILRYLTKNHISLGLVARTGRGPTFVRTIYIPNYQREIDELRSLEPPKNDEIEVNAIFKGMQKLINQARRRPQVWYKSSLFGDVYVPGTLSRRALEYGFEVCAASVFAKQPSRESVVGPE